MSQQPDNKQDFTTDSIVYTKKTLFDIIKGIFKSDKTIGELNGRWAAVFKICILLLFMLIPSLFGWGVWATSQINKARYETNIIYTYQEKSIADHRDRIREIENSVNKHSELVTRIPIIENRILEQEMKINNLDKKNSSDHAKIMTILEFIKAKVE